MTSDHSPLTFDILLYGGLMIPSSSFSVARPGGGPAMTATQARGATRHEKMCSPLSPRAHVPPSTHQDGPFLRGARRQSCAPPPSWPCTQLEVKYDNQDLLR